MGKPYLTQLISIALHEDIKTGDITTQALFPQPVKIKAEIIAKEDGVVCGAGVAKEVFRAVEKEIREDEGEEGIDRGRGIRVYNKVKDGRVVKKGQVICVVEGDARVILTAERTALNFLGHLSGIATLTRKYADTVRPYKVKIMDTRKTTPGLRELEKCAVRCGGGFNHRMGLYDQVLVKDNHIAAIRGQGSGVRGHLKEIIQTIREGVRRDKKGVNRGRERVKKRIMIEVEVEDLKGFKEALEARPDIVMLDNMSLLDIKKAVSIRNATLLPHYSSLTTKLEVSGGVTLANVRAIARTGVDIISVGALTHSARSTDFSLEVIACDP